MVASLLQGGFIPDLILYLSCKLSPMSVQPGFPLTNQSDFYTKYELPFRLALFWFSSNLCSIFASFLAVGVLRMRGVLGKAGWQLVNNLAVLVFPYADLLLSNRWLFLIERVTFLPCIYHHVLTSQ